jgi:hypothetical protein
MHKRGGMLGDWGLTMVCRHHGILAGSISRGSRTLDFSIVHSPKDCLLHAELVSICTWRCRHAMWMILGLGISRSMPCSHVFSWDKMCIRSVSTRHRCAYLRAFISCVDKQTMKIGIGVCYPFPS